MSAPLRSCVAPAIRHGLRQTTSSHWADRKRGHHLRWSSPLPRRLPLHGLPLFTDPTAVTVTLGVAQAFPRRSRSNSVLSHQRLEFPSQRPTHGLQRTLLCHLAGTLLPCESSVRTFNRLAHRRRGHRLPRPARSLFRAVPVCQGLQAWRGRYKNPPIPTQGNKRVMRFRA